MIALSEVLGRVTAAVVALALAAPGFGAAFAEPVADMGCCPTARDGHEHDGPTITRRCCCELERDTPAGDPELIAAVTGRDDRAAVIAVEVSPVLDAPRASRAHRRLPPPRGPPPRATLLAKKTSLLL